MKNKNIFNTKNWENQFNAGDKTKKRRSDKMLVAPFDKLSFEQQTIVIEGHTDK